MKGEEVDISNCDLAIENNLNSKNTLSDTIFQVKADNNGLVYRIVCSKSFRDNFFDTIGCVYEDTDKKYSLLNTDTKKSILINSLKVMITDVVKEAHTTFFSDSQTEFLFPDPIHRICQSINQSMLVDPSKFKRYILLEVREAGSIKIYGNKYTKKLVIIAQNDQNKSIDLMYIEPKSNLYTITQLLEDIGIQQ